MNQSSPPKISIITVCYQAGQTLEQTILSVLSQTYGPIEYIIIDGGSTDRTQELLQQYQDNVAIIVSEKDKGIYDAMNKGIAKASGDVIGFLNADDLFIHPNVVSTIANIFQDESVDACYADLVYFKETETQMKITRYFRSSPFKPGLFAKGWCLPHPTFYVRRCVFEQQGGFDLSYRIGNDVELMMRFLEKAKIVAQYVPEVWVKMRIGGVSNQSLKNILIQNQNILHAARNLDIPINPVQFTLFKILDRAKQFIQRPEKQLIF